MDPELPRLIGGGGYHTAPVPGEAADNNRLSAVFGVVKLFDRSVKSVQIGMNIIHTHLKEPKEAPSIFTQKKGPVTMDVCFLVYYETFPKLQFLGKQFWIFGKNRLQTGF
jgi:hypothetical protein